MNIPDGLLRLVTPAVNPAHPGCPLHLCVRLDSQAAPPAAAAAEGVSPNAAAAEGAATVASAAATVGQWDQTVSTSGAN